MLQLWTVSAGSLHSVWLMPHIIVLPPNTQNTPQHPCECYCSTVGASAHSMRMTGLYGGIENENEDEWLNEWMEDGHEAS